MMKQVRAQFSGHVQGVGFRYMVQSLSSQYPVKGFVRNVADGSVEVVVEGNEDDLKKFINSIQKSHLADYIRNMDLFWEEPQGQFQSFEIAI